MRKQDGGMDGGEKGATSLRLAARSPLRALKYIQYGNPGRRRGGSREGTVCMIEQNYR